MHIAFHFMRKHSVSHYRLEEKKKEFSISMTIDCIFELTLICPSIDTISCKDAAIGFTICLNLKYSIFIFQYYSGFCRSLTGGLTEDMMGPPHLNLPDF